MGLLMIYSYNLVFRTIVLYSSVLRSPRVLLLFFCVVVLLFSFLSPFLFCLSFLFSSSLLFFFFSFLLSLVPLLIRLIAGSSRARLMYISLGIFIRHASLGSPFRVFPFFFFDETADTSNGSIWPLDIWIFPANERSFPL